MTAESLHARLLAGGCALKVEADELVISPAPPPQFSNAITVLHTGVRALASGRVWYGSTGCASRKVRVVELDPTEPLPRDIELLTVAGDASAWDRVPPWMPLDAPELFEIPKEMPR